MQEQRLCATEQTRGDGRGRARDEDADREWARAGGRGDLERARDARDRERADADLRGRDFRAPGGRGLDGAPGGRGLGGATGRRDHWRDPRIDRAMEAQRLREQAAELEA